MNALAWMLALGILVFCMIEAVAFQKATVCRQIAWLKSTELRTGALLSKAKEKDRDWHVDCQLIIQREHSKISWQRLPSLKKRHFNLSLDGNL